MYAHNVHVRLKAKGCEFEAQRRQAKKNNKMRLFLPNKPLKAAWAE